MRGAVGSPQHLFDKPRPALTLEIYTPATFFHMPKANPRKQEQFVTKEALGELLTDQTSVILKAMEEGFESQDKRIEERFTAQNIALAAAMDKRLEPMEKRFNEKLDRLTTTLDRFLKRMTDVEEEFTFMKNDVNRIKAVLREKLGLSID
jgi:hypothetical protein